MRPVLLPPNPIQHFYRGGDRIAALRGIEQQTDFQPEEWLGATVSRFGEPEVGPSLTAEGPLAELVAADPTVWIGGGSETSGSTAHDVGVLVKLLDARQRLPVHVHPDRAFAAQHLDCPYGKTEAWYVLDADPGSALYVGWKEDVDADELARRRDAQDSEWMLDHLNRVPAREGMGMLVPAGTAHAIGEGVFVAEVQEPTDFSILLEWSVTTSTRDESHLDLGFDTAMTAVSTLAMGADEIDGLISTVGTAAPGVATESLLPAAADPYFSVLRGAAGGTFPASYAVIVVMSGSGRIEPVPPGTSDPIPVTAGQAYAMPHGYGPWRVTGDARVLACLPGDGWPASLRDGSVG